MDESQERTAEQMRAYLDEPPDLDNVMTYAELARWPDTDQARMTEQAKRAYIDEHLETCAWCGETRDWHNYHAARDHLFDPKHKVPSVVD